jgi:hypothetical protein
MNPAQKVSPTPVGVDDMVGGYRVDVELGAVRRHEQDAQWVSGVRPR